MFDEAELDLLLQGILVHDDDVKHGVSAKLLVST